jgi:hypothetical protein
MMPLMQSIMMSCFCHHAKDTLTWQVAKPIKSDTNLFDCKITTKFHTKNQSKDLLV